MSSELKKGKTPSKTGLYSATAAHALESIKVLAYEMKHGDNSNARIGAAKTILSKCIPDLRSVEAKLEGEVVVGLVLKVPEKNEK